MIDYIMLIHMVFERLSVTSGLPWREASVLSRKGLVFRIPLDLAVICLVNHTHLSCLFRIIG